MNECSFQECCRPVIARGMCSSHYKQLLRGQGLRELRHYTKAATNKERLLEKRIVDDTGCWLWTGGRSAQGYGMMRDVELQRTDYAHRISYRTFVGDIDDALVVHHKCNVRACINPDHLQAVTQIDNLAEMFDRRKYESIIAELEEWIATHQCGDHR